MQTWNSLIGAAIQVSPGASAVTIKLEPTLEAGTARRLNQQIEPVGDAHL